MRKSECVSRRQSEMDEVDRVHALPFLSARQSHSANAQRSMPSLGAKAGRSALFFHLAIGKLKERRTANPFFPCLPLSRGGRRRLRNDRGRRYGYRSEEQN